LVRSLSGAEEGSDLSAEGGPCTVRVVVCFYYIIR
jgi:hypothetical protein